MTQYKASCLTAADLKCNDEDVMTGNYNSCCIRLYCYCFISFSSWEHKHIAHPLRKLQRTLWRMTFTLWQSQKFPFRVMMQLRLQDTFRCIQITAMSMFDVMLTALTDLRLSEQRCELVSVLKPKYLCNTIQRCHNIENLIIWHSI